MKPQRWRRCAGSRRCVFLGRLSVLGQPAPSLRAPRRRHCCLMAGTFFGARGVRSFCLGIRPGRVEWGREGLLGACTNIFLGRGSPVNLAEVVWQNQDNDAYGRQAFVIRLLRTSITARCTPRPRTRPRIRSRSRNNAPAPCQPKPSSRSRSSAAALPSCRRRRCDELWPSAASWTT